MYKGFISHVPSDTCRWEIAGPVGFSKATGFIATHADREQVFIFESIVDSKEQRCERFIVCTLKIHLRGIIAGGEIEYLIGSAWKIFATASEPKSITFFSCITANGGKKKAFDVYANLKSDIDDIRESPTLHIAQTIAKIPDLELHICEPNLSDQQVQTLGFKQNKGLKVIDLFKMHLI